VKRIFGLVIAAFIILAMVGVGTWAYFSDTEASTGNTFTAGTLDLNINGGNTAVTMFTGLSNLKPGDNNDSSNATCTLLNHGSLAGKLSVASAMTAHSAGTNPADTDIVPTDSLKDTATMALYIDVDGNGVWSNGDIGLKSDGSTYAYTGASDVTGATGQAAVSAYNGSSWSNALAAMASNATVKFGVDYQVPSGATNAIQGGSVTFSFTFTLAQ
jgi:spore coat-associated protein N